jgi:phage tail sheath protein FI
MARTDKSDGVWKSPAGRDAKLIGVKSLQVNSTEIQSGQLNQVGVNCLRSFPVTGPLVWSARTLAGNDQLTSEYKYIVVRRTALFIENSIDRGTDWAALESNDETLWAQVRLTVGAFMNKLYLQGAFQGATSREAYFVKCDKESTPQSDIDSGVFNIIVGFAPLKPSEFIILKIQKSAGQVNS